MAERDVTVMTDSILYPDFDSMYRSSNNYIKDENGNEYIFSVQDFGTDMLIKIYKSTDLGSVWNDIGFPNKSIPNMRRNNNDRYGFFIDQNGYLNVIWFFHAFQFNSSFTTSNIHHVIYDGNSWGNSITVVSNVNAYDEQTWVSLEYINNDCYYFYVNGYDSVIYYKIYSNDIWSNVYSLPIEFANCYMEFCTSFSNGYIHLSALEGGGYPSEPIRYTKLDVLTNTFSNTEIVGYQPNTGNNNVALAMYANADTVIIYHVNRIFRYANSSWIVSEGVLGSYVPYEYGITKTFSDGADIYIQLYARNNSYVYSVLVLKSSDNGVTWDAPILPVSFSIDELISSYGSVDIIGVVDGFFEYIVFGQFNDNSGSGIIFHDIIAEEIQQNCKNPMFYKSISEPIPLATVVNGMEVSNTIKRNSFGVSNGTLFNNAKKIIHSNGFYYVVFECGASEDYSQNIDNQIYIYKSSDGVIWEDTVFPNVYDDSDGVSFGGNYSSIDSDQYGNIHCIFDRYSVISGNYKGYCRYDFNSGLWGNVENILLNDHYSEDPMFIVVDKYDVVQVIFSTIYSTSNLPYGLNGSSIFVMRRVNGIWETPQVIFQKTENELYLLRSIDMNSDKSLIYFIADVKPSVQANSQLMYSVYDCLTLSCEQMKVIPIIDYNYPNICVDKNNVIHIVSADTSSNTISYTHQTDSILNTWSPIEVINDNNEVFPVLYSNALSPVISVDDSLNVHVAWSSGANIITTEKKWWSGTGNDLNNTMTSTTPIIVNSTTQFIPNSISPKFGTGMMYFNGDNSFVQFDNDDSEYFNFGLGDFTIDFWLCPLSYNKSSLFSQLNESSNTGRCPILIETFSSGDDIKIWFSFDNLSWVEDTYVWRKTGIALNVWYHIALTRNGSNFMFFVNGEQVGNTYINTNSFIDTSNYTRLGINAETGIADYNGFIDEYRISKGIARYTSNFTTPTMPYQNNAQYDSVLLHCDGSEGSSDFPDDGELSYDKMYDWSVYVKTQYFLESAILPDSYLSYSCKWNIPLADYLYLEFSTDGGLNWNVIKTYDATQISWTSEIIDITQYNGQELHYRFKYLTNSYYFLNGFEIKDFKVFNGGVLNNIEQFTLSGFVLQLEGDVRQSNFYQLKYAKKTLDEWVVNVNLSNNDAYYNLNYPAINTDNDKVMIVASDIDSYYLTKIYVWEWNNGYSGVSGWKRVRRLKHF